ncbi:MAG: hypothetical protein LBE82_07115 [Chitinophagaceae bacterium]|jgi:hypothetical protein|nr:hypothetical protein [Chitinophagaceae bacterium]
MKSTKAYFFYSLLFLFIAGNGYTQNIFVEDKINNINKRVEKVDSLKELLYIVNVDGIIQSKKKLFLKRKIKGGFFEDYAFEKDRLVRIISGLRLFTDSTNVIKLFVLDTCGYLCYYKETKFNELRIAKQDTIYSIEYYLDKGKLLFQKTEGKFPYNIEEHLNEVIKKLKDMEDFARRMIPYSNNGKEEIKSKQ